MAEQGQSPDSNTTGQHHGAFLAQAQSILSSLIDVFGESQQVEELVTSLNEASNSQLSSTKGQSMLHIYVCIKTFSSSFCP